MRTILAFFLAILTLTSCQQPLPKESPRLPVKMVIVTMFEQGNDTGDTPGELQYWAERLPLPDTLAFPQGYRPLRYNPDLQVLSIVTGVGNTKAAASIMGLGMDPRFDLTKAYWLVAGISGIDPLDAPAGSAVWAEYLVDGDLSHQVDAREIPDDWETGYIPLRRSRPYEEPVSEKTEGVIAQLNPAFVEWAFQLTKEVELLDDEKIKAIRQKYIGYPAADMQPIVMKGDQLAASTYWHGKLLNDWANDWIQYWSEGKGNFVTSAMEEMGTYHALDRLDQAGKVDKNRLLVLRTGSNFTMQWPGIMAHESLTGEKLGKGYTAYIPSLEAAYRVGSPVVQAILDNWETYQDQLPQ